MENINLMKIYTRKGDSGETSLFGGTKIKKSSQKVSAYGAIDEANSFLGFCRSLINDFEIKEIILEVQNSFFTIGAELSSDTKGIILLKNKITSKDILFIEKNIDKFTEKIPKFSKFTIPGEDIVSSAFHIARTAIRRAEREVISLAIEEQVSKELISYLNRVSDLLYTFTRVIETENYIQLIKKQILNKINTASPKTISKLTLSVAKKMIEIGEAKAKELGKPFTFTVLNSEGNIIIQERMDDCILISLEVSKKKAYTAVSLKLPTSEVFSLIQPGAPFYTLQNDENIIGFGGGIPLFDKENLLGAIGVSGSSVEEDLIIANACVDWFYQEATNEY